jgi:hypothetical protein
MDVQVQRRPILRHRVEVKNPKAPAVTRVAEEPFGLRPLKTRRDQPPQELIATLARAVLREDAGFHAYQMMEAGVRQFTEWHNTPCRSQLLAHGGDQQHAPISP